MALSKKVIPSLSECRCLICMEIFIEPVTLPCNHTLCNPSFQATVEKASLCCPFCRRRVSSWTRYHIRKNSLINTDLWEIIQNHYAKECKLRIGGQESKEIFDDYQPVHLLSKPGELRREYEEEISKNNNNERNIMTSPLSSRKSDPVTNRSQKRNQSKQTVIGATEQYLSPKSKSGSASQSEVMLEEDKKSIPES